MKKSFSKYLTSHLNSMILNEIKEVQKHCNHEWRLFHVNGCSISQKCAKCGKVRYIRHDRLEQK